MRLIGMPIGIVTTSLSRKAAAPDGNEPQQHQRNHVVAKRPGIVLGQHRHRLGGFGQWRRGAVGLRELRVRFFFGGKLTELCEQLAVVFPKQDGQRGQHQQQHREEEREPAGATPPQAGCGC